jgi:hypothetical protein
VIDTTIVIDYGVHDLPDATAGQIEAIELVRSLRASLADLMGRHCSVSATDEDGGGVCIIPLEFE